MGLNSCSLRFLWTPTLAWIGFVLLQHNLLMVAVA